MMDKVNIETQLTTFFEGLRSGVSCMKELRKSYDRKMAFDFNSLNFFYPGENKTSEILAFFLNPHAAHGQGDAFLKCFCSTLLPQESPLLPQKLPSLIPEDYSTATVKTEKRTDQNRRIDIVVRFPKEKIFIGIENKIWAKDQKMQLNDYAAYLEKESGGNYHLIYLTPDGHEPSKGSIPKAIYETLVQDNKISCRSYESDIIPLVDGFVQVCMAENVQAFLKEFQKYLKQQYRGEKEMDEERIIEKFITKKENMALALGVAQQVDVVKNELWKETVKQVEDWGSKNGCTVEINASSYDAMNERGDTPLLNMTSACDHQWSFGLRFEGNRTALYHRLLVRQDLTETDVLDRARSKLGYEFPDKENSNINDWFTPFHGDWISDPRPWEAMIVKSESEELNRFAAAIIDKYEEAKDVMDSILSKHIERT